MWIFSKVQMIRHVCCHASECHTAAFGDFSFSLFPFARSCDDAAEHRRVSHPRIRVYLQLRGWRRHHNEALPLELPPQIAKHCLFSLEAATLFAQRVLGIWFPFPPRGSVGALLRLGCSKRKMAAAEMRAAWHRTAATCYMLHEDSKRGNKPDESYSSSRTKTPPANSKSELSEAWNAVSSHYFVPDRKLDFHFHIENDGESPSKAKSLLQVEVGAGAGAAKSLEMDWQTVDSPSTYSADGKAADRDWTLAEKTSVSCLSDSSFRALAARNLELITQTGPRWRHANKGELAALIARKSSEDMGNCDLPPPLSPAAAKGLKEDAFHGGIGLEKVAVPPGLPPPSTFRPGSLDTKMKSKNSPEESHAKRSAHAEEDRNEEAFWKELDSELLGEALCRSQTRAREAEKRAVEAMSERDQLLKLFFREASVTLTYKHWVKYLEAENSILRRQDQEEVEAEVENAAENKQDNKRSSKRQQQDAARSKKRRHSDHHSVAVLGCGLAFALGVGLAGAGVVFGCTMGWILIAF